MAAQQLADLRRAAERIGDDLGAGQRDRRLDPAVALGNEVRTGREGAAVSLGQPLERRAVRVVRKAQGDGALPGSRSVRSLIQVESTRLRHERIMASSAI
jgi:hypothetical protein